MKNTKISKTTAIAITSVAVLLFGGLITVGNTAKTYAATPIELTFVCCDENRCYDDITLEVCPCMTGLETKEALASALNDGGNMPTDIFLLYEEEDNDIINGQIYDCDAIGDYLSDGDKIYYLFAPICNGEIYGDDGYRFECYGYDQYSGEFFYTVRP